MDDDYGDYLYEQYRDEQYEESIIRRNGEKMVRREDGKAVWYTWSAEEMLWIED